jgi:hypothetical protein
MLTFVALSLLQAAPFHGTFHAEQGRVTLCQQKTLVRGTITLGSERVSLRGKITGGVLVGQAVDGYRKHFTFRATLVDRVLSITIETDTIDFIRETKTAAVPRRRQLERSS